MPDEVVVPPSTDAGQTPPGDAAPPGLDTDADILAALEKTNGTSTEDDKTKKPADKVKAKDAVKDPETPKESAVLRGIKHREAALQQEKQAFALQQQQATASIEQRIQAGIQAALKEQFKDPRVAVKTLTGLGLVPNDIAQALVAPDNATPEELARKAIEETKQLKQKLEQDAKLQAGKGLETEFLRDVQANADKHLHLHEEWEEPEILQQAYAFGRELIAECTQKGIQVPNISNVKILQILDRRAKARQDRRVERAKAKTPADDDPQKKAAAQAATKAKQQNGSGHQGKTTGASSTATLGKGLGERQTIATQDPVLMSNDDVLAAVNKQLSEGFNVKVR